MRLPLAQIVAPVCVDVRDRPQIVGLVYLREDGLFLRGRLGFGLRGVDEASRGLLRNRPHILVLPAHRHLLFFYCRVLVLLQLLPDLVGDPHRPLPVQPEFPTQALRKILRHVVRVVDVPLKFIAQLNLVDSNVQLDCLYQLGGRRALGPPVLDGLADFLRDFVLLLQGQTVFFGQHLGEGLWGQIALARIPAEVFLYPAAVDVQVQAHWDQGIVRILLGLSLYFQPRIGVYLQGQVLRILCIGGRALAAVGAHVAGLVGVEVLEPFSQDFVDAHLVALYLALEPERKRGVVDARFAGHVHLLDAELLQGLLDSLAHVALGVLRQHNLDPERAELGFEMQIGDDILD